MPARRIRKSQKTVPKTKKIIRWGILLLVSLLVVSIIRLLTLRIYTKDYDRLAIASYSDEKTQILIFDKTHDEISIILIPNTTEVDTSRGYGYLKLGSVWKLSFLEKLEGRLFIETLTKYLGMPVVVWINNGDILVNPSRLARTRFLFSNSQSPLTWADKLHLFLFSLKIPSQKTKTIELADSSFLIQKTLQDGSSGYVKDSNILPNIVSYYFVDSTIQELNPRIRLINNSSDLTLSENIKNIIETVGGRVLFIEKNYNKDFTECEIEYQKAFKKVAEKFSQILQCSDLHETTETFDITLRFGDNYAREF